MDKRIFMLLGAVILIGGVIAFLRYRLNEATAECGDVVATVSPEVVLLEAGDSIAFSDQTVNGKQWLWDFGDGSGTSEKQSGKYLFTRTGRFPVTLTVNGSCTATYYVTVNTMIVDTDKVVAKITASTSTIHAGEAIQYKGEASGAKEWFWKFGESGMMDSKVQNPTYTYKIPGQYTITLKTDIAKKPAVLVVNVLPRKEVTPVVIPGNKTPPVPKKPMVTMEQVRDCLQRIAETGVGTKGDFAWFNDNFVYGRGTPLKTNISSEYTVLSDLLTEFAANTDLYEITEVKIVPDKKHEKVASLVVNLKKH